MSLATPSERDDAALDALIAEATVDCFTIDEERTAMAQFVEERLRLPFVASVLGTSVTVRAVELSDENDLVAVVKTVSGSRRVALLDLSLPSPSPRGAESIAAYRRWQSTLP